MKKKGKFQKKYFLSSEWINLLKQNVNFQYIVGRFPIFVLYMHFCSVCDLLREALEFAH
jgi:hypothetical protein